jgi:hypothetical protein
MMRPTNVKGKVKDPEICGPPVALIPKQTFEKGDRLPPLPFLDPDQMGDLPEI